MEWGDPDVMPIGVVTDGISMGKTGITILMHRRYSYDSPIPHIYITFLFALIHLPIVPFILSVAFLVILPVL